MPRLVRPLVNHNRTPLAYNSDSDYQTSEEEMDDSSVDENSEERISDDEIHANSASGTAAAIGEANNQTLVDSLPITPQSAGTSFRPPSTAATPFVLTTLFSGSSTTAVSSSTTWTSRPGSYGGLTGPARSSKRSNSGPLHGEPDLQRTEKPKQLSGRAKDDTKHPNAPVSTLPANELTSKDVNKKLPATPIRPEPDSRARTVAELVAFASLPVQHVAIIGPVAEQVKNALRLCEDDPWTLDCYEWIDSTRKLPRCILERQYDLIICSDPDELTDPEYLPDTLRFLRNFLCAGGAVLVGLTSASSPQGWIGSRTIPNLYADIAAEAQMDLFAINGITISDPPGPTDVKRGRLLIEAAIGKHRDIGVEHALQQLRQVYLDMEKNFRRYHITLELNGVYARQQEIFSKVARLWGTFLVGTEPVTKSPIDWSNPPKLVWRDDPAFRKGKWVRQTSESIDQGLALWQLSSGEVGGKPAGNDGHRFMKIKEEDESTVASVAVSSGAVAGKAVLQTPVSRQTVPSGGSSGLSHADDTERLAAMTDSDNRKADGTNRNEQDAEEEYSDDDDLIR